MKPTQPQLAHSPEGITTVIPVGRTTVFALIKSGELKARKLGGRTVILDEDLRAYLAGLPSIK